VRAVPEGLQPLARVILAGDIGGTNTRLALFNGDPRVPTRLAVYPSAEHDGLGEMVEGFLAEAGTAPEAASFGIAGVIRDGRADGVNLRWSVESDELALQLGLARVGLINDLEANAYGIAALAGDDVAVLSAGEEDATGNAALLSAGTGLGQSGLYWDGAGYRPFATEGGHADFGPRNELQIALLRYLTDKYGHVSYERICSGGGLVDVHSFFCNLSGDPEPELTAAEISAAAIDGSSPTASRALDLFVSVYGAQAGNLALSLGATGGVYLGGGIAPKILPRLQQGFMGPFLSKGRFRTTLERIPVRVILNDKAALLGAARHAANGGTR